MWRTREDTCLDCKQAVVQGEGEWHLLLDNFDRKSLPCVIPLSPDPGWFKCAEVGSQEYEEDSAILLALRIWKQASSESYGYTLKARKERWGNWLRYQRTPWAPRIHPSPFPRPGRTDAQTVLYPGTHHSNSGFMVVKPSHPLCPHHVT